MSLSSDRKDQQSQNFTVDPLSRPRCHSAQPRLLPILVCLCVLCWAAVCHDSNFLNLKLQSGTNHCCACVLPARTPRSSLTCYDSPLAMEQGQGRVMLCARLELLGVRIYASFELRSRGHGPWQTNSLTWKKASQDHLVDCISDDLHNMCVTSPLPGVRRF